MWITCRLKGNLDAFIYVCLCILFTQHWGPFRGATNVASLNFKTLLFMYWGGSHVPVGILLLYLRLSSSLSQFQSISMSFVAISSVLCRCFKAMVLVEIYPNRASTLSCHSLKSLGGVLQSVLKASPVWLLYSLSWYQWVVTPTKQVPFK